MLNIQHLEHLEHVLHIPVAHLVRVAESSSEYVKELTAWDPAHPEKPRPVIGVFGDLRTIQERLLCRVYRTKLKPAVCSFGGVRGKTIVANALAHQENEFLYLTDISKFYPGISNTRVNRFLMNEMRCSPAVARLLTKLCTYEYHLALGLVTSPILADQILHRVDKGIAGACAAAGMTYTRWVDDVAISAKFDIEESGIPDLIARIFRRHGFAINESKDEFGRISEGFAITKVRFVKGHPDVTAKYMHEVERQLADHASLSRGRTFQGPLQGQRQLRGKIMHVCWINSAHKKRLLSLLNRIDWFNVQLQADLRGLAVLRRTVSQRGFTPSGYAEYQHA